MTAANSTTREKIIITLASGVDGGYGDAAEIEAMGLTIRDLDAVNVALVTEEVETVYGDDYDVTVTAAHRMVTAISAPDGTIRAHVESLIEMAAARYADMTESDLRAAAGK